MVMIDRNIYIFYPAGWHGSYLRWALEVSDQDRVRERKVILDPINHSDQSGQHGGLGTSHLHTRIPTHQGWEFHRNWQILNRPSEPLIYLISPGTEDNLPKKISEVLYSDPNPIIIVIHHNDDPLTESFGHIQGVTKWPVWMETMPFQSSIRGRYHLNNIFQSDFDPYDCAHNLMFRDFLVVADYLYSLGPLDREQLQKNIEKYQKIYSIRNRVTPHEVNDQTYISNYDPDFNNIIEIDLKNIVSDNFPEQLTVLVDRYRISNNWNSDILQQRHGDFIQAQKNLQWFDSIRAWQETGLLDDYLQSHSVIESQVMREIFRRDPPLQQELDQNNQRQFFWQFLDLESINQKYQQRLIQKQQFKNSVLTK